ncbi:MAG: TonB-dependent receptor [Acidobacteriota bacterium]|nr:TonB-dependent receptor [Acidobacteriota bacterium]
MFRFLGLLGILGGAIPCLALVADQPTQPARPATAEDPAVVRPEPHFDEELIVTATLEEIPEAELPASVTVFDARAIETRQATTVLDLLRSVPGMTVAQSGGPGDVTSVFLRGTSSTQTLVLWNGVPLNDPYFGGFDWAHLGTEGVERVEVVRGPLSTVYGSDAVGGVVQLITDRPEGSRLSVEAGERNYGRGMLSLGGSAGEVALQGVGTYSTDDGLLVNDDYTTGSAQLRGRWQARDGLTVSLLSRLQDSELGIPRSGAVLTPNRRQEARSIELAAPVTAVWGSWQLEGHLARTEAEFNFRDPDAGFSLNDTETERLRTRAVLSYDLGGTSWIGGGADWQEDEVSNVTTFGTNLDGVNQENLSTFVQLHHGGERWTAEVAVRRDEHESFGGEWSPSAGFSLALGSSARLRFSYGEGFRAPSLGELFFPFSGNPDLQPEISRSYEAGIDVRSGDWSFDLALFDQEVEELIQFDSVTFVNVNIGQAESRGAELALRWSRRDWAAELTGTYLDSEDRATGESLLRRPEESASLRVAWRPGPWTLQVLGRYVGERADVDPITFGRTTNDSYTTVDLTARWDIGWFEPYARVLNLADEDYQEVLGFPAPGRTFVGGVAVGF